MDLVGLFAQSEDEHRKLLETIRSQRLRDAFDLKVVSVAELPDQQLLVISKNSAEAYVHAVRFQLSKPRTLGNPLQGYRLPTYRSSD